jgi:hypothetical protein
MHGRTRSTHFDRKPREKEPLGELVIIGRLILKWILELARECETVNRIQVAQVAFMNTVMNVRSEAFTSVAVNITVFKI